MPVIIHCVRHAQGYHNVTEDWTLQDPDLTPIGQADSITLGKERFPDQNNISLVLASPLRRTLHTAALAFRPALTGNKKCLPNILAFPQAQEISSDLCDTGSDPDVLAQYVQDQGWAVDLCRVGARWNHKGRNTYYGPEHVAIKDRARDLRKRLHELGLQLMDEGDAHPEIVLVTHGSFLHYLTDDWEEAARTPGTGWRNCETRSYMMNMEDKMKFKMIETRESRVRRGVLAVSCFSQYQQDEMFEEAMQAWVAQGLQRPDRLPKTEEEDKKPEWKRTSYQNLVTSGGWYLTI